MIYRFTVDGPLYGYRASVRRAFDPKYKAFKEKCRMLALEAGVPAELDPKAVTVYLSVLPYWKRGPRIDWKNVYGAVEDGIFEQDRWVHPGVENDFFTKCPAESADIVIEVD